MKVAAIGKFLGNNSAININVYGIEDRLDAGKRVYDVIGPLYYSKDRRANHINLLYIESNTDQGPVSYIKNVSSLVGRQL